jgi:hypothetical protein
LTTITDAQSRMRVRVWLDPDRRVYRWKCLWCAATDHAIWDELPNAHDAATRHARYCLPRTQVVRWLPPTTRPEETR